MRFVDVLIHAYLFLVFFFLGGGGVIFPLVPRVLYRVFVEPIWRKPKSVLRTKILVALSINREQNINQLRYRVNRKNMSYYTFCIIMLNRPRAQHHFHEIALNNTKICLEVIVHMKWIFFLHNFTVRCVNKSIVNVKVLLHKIVVMFLVLKSTQFLSRNGQDTGTSFIVQFHPVT